MSLLSHDRFWDAVIRFPSTKKMLDLAMKKCDVCGKTVLEAALDDYVGKQTRNVKDAAASTQR